MRCHTNVSKSLRRVSLVQCTRRQARCLLQLLFLLYQLSSWLLYPLGKSIILVIGESPIIISHSFFFFKFSGNVQIFLEIFAFLYFNSVIYWKSTSWYVCFLFITTKFGLLAGIEWSFLSRRILWVLFSWTILDLYMYHLSEWSNQSWLLFYFIHFWFSFHPFLIFISSIFNFHFIYF